MIVNLAMDVYCEWLGYEPAYRVYVDTDLLTERTYAWNNQHQYVREHLSVDLTPGEHTVRVEPIIDQGMQAVFTVKNFTVDNRPVTLTNNTFAI